MENEKILKETMAILNKFFYLRCQNSPLIIENEGDKGWFYMNEETAMKLKRLLIKYEFK